MSIFELPSPLYVFDYNGVKYIGNQYDRMCPICYYSLLGSFISKVNL